MNRNSPRIMAKETHVKNKSHSGRIKKHVNYQDKLDSSIELQDET
jgi:hypothetical protein